MPIPFLIPVAGAMAGAALGGADSILPSKAERENRKRIREMEMSALGLTPQERAALEAQYAGKTEGAQRAAERTAASYAAMSQAGSGAAMARGQQAYSDATKLGREVAADMAAANQQRKAQMEAELQDRKDVAATYASNRRRAVADIGSAGLEAYQMQKGQTELTNQPVLEVPGARASTLSRLAGLDDATWDDVKEKLLGRGVSAADIEAVELMRADETLSSAKVR